MRMNLQNICVTSFEAVLFISFRFMFDLQFSAEWQKESAVSRANEEESDRPCTGRLGLSSESSTNWAAMLPPVQELHKSVGSHAATSI